MDILSIYPIGALSGVRPLNLLTILSIANFILAWYERCIALTLTILFLRTDNAFKLSVRLRNITLASDGLNYDCQCRGGKQGPPITLSVKRE